MVFENQKHTPNALMGWFFTGGFTTGYPYWTPTGSWSIFLASKIVTKYICDQNLIKKRREGEIAGAGASLVEGYYFASIFCFVFFANEKNEEHEINQNLRHQFDIGHNLEIDHLRSAKGFHLLGVLPIHRALPISLHPRITVIRTMKVAIRTIVHTRWQQKVEI